MDYEAIKRRAKERFAEYTKNYDLTQPKIALKAKHTIKVTELCEKIARSENLSEEDVTIAWFTGLLHDIGRFEQVTRFNTFIDANSVDHAHLSCEILFGTDSMKPEDRCPGLAFTKGIMNEFWDEKEFYPLIKTAIYYHSCYRYPENLTEREKLFCDILRDADKLDILRVNLETPMSEIHNVPMEEFYNSTVTDEVLKAFYEHHCILRALKRTAIDNVVGYISLYWELVFSESRNIAKTDGYLDKLCHFPSKNQATLLVFSQIRKEIGIE